MSETNKDANKKEKDNERKEDSTETQGKDETLTGTENRDQDKEESANTESRNESEEEKEKKEETLQELSKEELIGKVEKLRNSLSDSEEEKGKLEENLEKWKDKSENFLDRLQRLQADFENSQKRWDKTRKNLKNQYIGDILQSFLPLYDSFKSAIGDIEKDSSLRQFYKQFLNILKSYGAEPMKVSEGDQFHYNKHEALSSIEREDLPNNTIVDVVQDGWKLNNEVLRYAKVIISRKPEPKKEEKDKDTEEKKEDKEAIKEDTKNSETQGKETDSDESNK